MIDQTLDLESMQSLKFLLNLNCPARLFNIKDA